MELTVKTSTKAYAVHGFIRRFIKAHGYSPSVRDIGTALTLSTSVVSYCLDILQEQGYIKHDNGIARSIRIIKYDEEKQTAKNDAP